MTSLEDSIEFATNPEPRCPCVLLIDTSASMSGEPIAALNQGLLAFRDDLVNDALAAKRVEIAIITFGGSPLLTQDFVTLDQFSPPTLSASGSTPMGAAIIQAVDLVKARKDTYKANGINYYRPWIFLITDGAPTDDWSLAASRLRSEENGKALALFAVGVEGADMDTLKQIAVREPRKLKGLDFTSLFVWLSRSQQSKSRSKPEDQVGLPPAGWAIE